SLLLGYQNVRGICIKLTDLYLNSVSFPFNVIAFTETWLKNDILDTEIFSSRFSVYRRDRKVRRGGGVLIAVDAQLNSELFDHTSDIELVAVRLSFGSLNIF
ncbi:hypothetical protein KR215_010558, partial [Drosophila sulfurigaster]